MALIDFAILAPIPLEHLQPGAEVARSTGFVSFGSYKFKLFRDVDGMKQGERVPVIIYPSHETAVVHTSFRITWCGWYIGHVEMYDEKRNAVGVEITMIRSHNSLLSCIKAIIC